MILKLSATSDKNLPASPCVTYLRMIKQSKALGVAMVINVGLSIRGCQVEVPTTMANATLTANFRANSLSVAHSSSIFIVPYIDAANMGSYNKTELDLLQIRTGGNTVRDGEKVSGKSIQVPFSYAPSSSPIQQFVWGTTSLFW